MNVSLETHRAGDGFSRRAEDAILHGCLPVIIMDDVDEKFSNVVDYEAFSVRIAERDVDKVSKLHQPRCSRTLDTIAF